MGGKLNGRHADTGRLQTTDQTDCCSSWAGLLYLVKVSGLYTNSFMQLVQYAFS
jgi:hypothetical protein